jgi:hypothetical protein
MTTRTIQPTLDKALSRSPEYTQPSAELVALRAEVAELLQRVRTLELQASAHNAYLERIKAASNPAW